MFTATPELITINDSNYLQHLAQEQTDGRMKGMMPRNYRTHPLGCYSAAKPFSMPLIPVSEQQGRLDYQIANNSSANDIRNIGMAGSMIPSRDQDGQGYCWGHSPPTCMLAMRAMMGEPYADLSPFSVCCPIKNFRDEGGWNAEAVQYIAENGVATSATWPQQSMSRSNVAASAEERKKYKFTEWMDLDPGDMEQQMITVLLTGGVLAGDFPWWSHSVAIVALLALKPLKVLIWNSWSDSWSQKGVGALEGRKAVPSGGAIALLVATASQA